jgi:tellurite resistance protein TerC
VSQTALWIAFNLFVAIMLALDLFVFNRRSRSPGMKEAIGWSVLWIALAIAFAAILYFWHGRADTLEFATGYLIELSLSADNLFVFILIFAHFRVPPEYQHKVLFWGVIGALMMRAAFIFLGVGLITRFEWVIYIFGAFLVFTGLRLLRGHGVSMDLDNNWAVRSLRRLIPVTTHYEKDKFFVSSPKLSATPLFVVLLVVELTDLLFATDSIPAILAITYKTFIIYSSNVFAILGLRSMYFALSHMMRTFRYLHYGLALILIFIGAKMLASHYLPISTVLALGVVAAILVASVLASKLIAEEG